MRTHTRSVILVSGIQYKMTHEHIENGTITSPQGFSAGATFVDIKAWKSKPFDLAMLLAEVPCTTAGVFTTNKVKAAPLLLSQKHMMNRKAQALVVNSGCANACTSYRGFADAEKMASLAAKRLGLQPDNVLVASTGVIGTYLPMGKIECGIEQIELTPDGGHHLAQAIMTTDTVPKEIAVSFDVDGSRITIGGVAKGAGMIHPNMATMLCFLTTDAAVDPDFLQASLKKSVDVSFNLVTVDGDTSPNDTVMMFANGLAGNTAMHVTCEEADIFQSALDEVCTYLAKCIARDGEGSTKLIEVTVEGALSAEDARMAARTIAGSPLVKTAVYGADPNWGRIVAAAGRSGAEVVESKIDLYLDDLRLMEAGIALPFDGRKAETLMKREEVFFRLCLNLGEGQATAWGCALTEQYIALNSDYTT